MYEFTKLWIYAMLIIELARIAHLYFIAYNEMKKTPVIKSMFLFLCTVTFYFVYRFIFSYTVFIGAHMTWLRYSSILPAILILLSVRNFRIQSLKKTEIKKCLKE